METRYKARRVVYEATIRITEHEGVDVNQCGVYGQCPVCNAEYGIYVGDRSMTDNVLEAVSVVTAGILCCNHKRN